MKTRLLLIAVLWLPARLMPGARLAAGGAASLTEARPPAVSARPAASAVVNFADLARRVALKRPGAIPPQPCLDSDADEGNETEPDEAVPAGPASAAAKRPAVPPAPSGPAPGPALSFAGLDAIPKVGGATNFVSPDTCGAVGLDKLLVTLNNNYRVQRKSDGLILSTVSIDAFWSATGAGNALDPKTLYDPYNDRWILVAITDFNTPTAGIGVGVSLTSDPGGSYFLTRFRADLSGALTSDFPELGFNLNWVAVSYSLATVGTLNAAGTKLLVVDYPQLRASAVVATTFSTTAGTAFQFNSPAATYSASEPVLYIPKHLNASLGTFRVDTLTGTPSVPVYTQGAVKSGGPVFANQTGQIIPQAAPLAGASACGATPCPIGVQDGQIRETPVVRGGFLYYAQTVGLPAGGVTHTGIHWLKYDLAAGAVVDGGTIEDPSATSNNGGKWYDAAHLAVNQYGDILLGFTQFSSTQFASAGYAFHSRTDPLGTMSTPFIFKAGEDYYHKTAGGYNRWGDYSKAQVDPSNDTDLWVLQEYARARVGTDDGSDYNTNSSRWGTWWAKVSPVLPSETAPGNAGPVSGQQWPDKTTMTWAVNPSATGGYRLYRGVAADLPKLLTGAPNACLRFTGADQNATTAAGLNDDPSAAGGLYWYLVVGVNPFGEGPAGNGTAGPRFINSGGLCP